MKNSTVNLFLVITITANLFAILLAMGLYIPAFFAFMVPIFTFAFIAIARSKDEQTHGHA